MGERARGGWKMAVGVEAGEESLVPTDMMEESWVC